MKKRTLWRKLSALVGCSLPLIGCSKEAPRQPSARPGVQVLEQEFRLPGLDRQRTLRVYLPPGYAASDRRYPVLYMHDGQNLFDEATSYAGEWQVDESLDQLHEESGFAVIVVGIDNGGDKRMNELSPWPNAKFGDAEGRAYMDFIVQVVKKHIDETYRTLADQPNTAIMGSSMGGLISHYAIFAYPQIFSKAGVFSPSFWFSDDAYAFSTPDKLAGNARLYFLMGAEEGADSVAKMRQMVTQLSADGLASSQIVSRVVPGGEHNEAFWRAEFRAAVSWLFAAD